MKLQRCCNGKIGGIVEKIAVILKVGGMCIESDNVGSTTKLLIIAH